MSDSETKQTTPGVPMTPEFLAAVAEGVGAALSGKVSAFKTPEAAAPTAPVTPAELGAALGRVAAPLAAPVLAKAGGRIKSRKLWVTLGTLATLAAQNPLGLELHPAAQVAVAALAAVYVAAQAGVDSSKKDDPHA
jgi:hypothetical protein